MYYECEDLDTLYEKLGAQEVVERWNITGGSWFARPPAMDGSNSVATCEKIFGIRRQLNGRLERC